MSSGSALYHWETDYDLLYGKNNRELPDFRVLKQLVQ